MTPEQNADLLSAYRAEPSLRNRNRVVSANLGLVEKAADRFSRLSRIPFDDLYSVGCVGLIKATEKFDLSTGNRFSSYAMPRIRGEMMHYQRDKQQPGGVRIPRAWIDRRKKILVGDFTGIKIEDAAAAAQAVQYREPTRLDMSDGDDDGPGIQLMAPPDSQGTLSASIEDLLIMPLFTPPDKTDYFNATQIANRYGRQVSHWRQIPRTVSLLKDFDCKENGKAGIISKRGRNGETWVHRDLAADFLRWVSPESAALVCYAYSQAVADRLTG